MCFALMSWVACGWLARSVARCVFQRATERDDGSSKVFEAADLLVSPCLLLCGSVACGVGRWPVMASDRGDENFKGSCAEIPKLSTGRSLNSCVDVKSTRNF